MSGIESEIVRMIAAPYADRRAAINFMSRHLPEALVVLGRFSEDIERLREEVMARAAKKPGRGPRTGESLDKPWLRLSQPMSRATYYRRKAEGKLP